MEEQYLITDLDTQKLKIMSLDYPEVPLNSVFCKCKYRMTSCTLPLQGGGEGLDLENTSNTEMLKQIRPRSLHEETRTAGNASWRGGRKEGKKKRKLALLSLLWIGDWLQLWLTAHKTERSTATERQRGLKRKGRKHCRLWQEHLHFQKLLTGKTLPDKTRPASVL